MSVTLSGVNNTPNLQSEYSRMSFWYNSTLPKYPTGSAYCTIADFYEEFIVPRLPDTQTVIEWTKLLLNYVKQDDAVFAIRAFFSWQNVKNNPADSDSQLAITNGKKVGDNNPYSLRRGFLTEFKNSKYKFFYSDNFLAAYFMKMAYDGFVPLYGDFISELQNRTFPARFGRSCAAERAIAAYNINGKTAKDPGIQRAGYKVAHVIDSGTNYVNSSGNHGLSQICNCYFPRGWYSDWKFSNGYYSRQLSNTQGIDYLKAHFLRFVCPINYFLAPKANINKKVYQSYGQTSGLTTNKPDIAELPELQKYVIGQFYNLYGKVYVDYLDAIMWSKNTTIDLKNIITQLSIYGSKIIALNI